MQAGSAHENLKIKEFLTNLDKFYKEAEKIRDGTAFFDNPAEEMSFDDLDSSIKNLQQIINDGLKGNISNSYETELNKEFAALQRNCEYFIFLDNPRLQKNLAEVSRLVKILISTFGDVVTRISQINHSRIQARKQAEQTTSFLMHHNNDENKTDSENMSEVRF